MPEKNSEGELVITIVDVWDSLEALGHRITKLERFMWKAVGGGVVIGFAATQVVYLVHH